MSEQHDEGRKDGFSRIMKMRPTMKTSTFSIYGGEGGEAEEEEMSFWSKLPTFMVPTVFKIYNEDALLHSTKLEEVVPFRVYDNLNIYQRIFICFEYPENSLISLALGLGTMLVILLSVVTSIMQTNSLYQYTPDWCSSPVCNNDPIVCPDSMVCQPQPSLYFQHIDAICVYIFTAEYFARLLTLFSVPGRIARIVPSQWDEDEHKMALLEEREPMQEPTYGFINTLFRYTTLFNNLIDFAAIVPYYIAVAGAGGNGSTTFVRVIRIFRLFRFLKLSNASRGTLNLLFVTMENSMEALFFLTVVACIIFVVVGSIQYLLECGVFTANSLYPDGIYLRMTSVNNGREISPFVNVQTSIYWAVVTITTVGYGDLVPTSNGGRVLASVCSLFGILMLALPVSVISSNFTKEYNNYVEKQKQFKIAKRHEDMIAKASKKINKGDTSKRTTTVKNSTSYSYIADHHHGNAGHPSMHMHEQPHTPPRLLHSSIDHNQQQHEHIKSSYHNPHDICPHDISPEVMSLLHQLPPMQVNASREVLVRLISQMQSVKYLFCIYFYFVLPHDDYKPAGFVPFVYLTTSRLFISQIMTGLRCINDFTPGPGATGFGLGKEFTACFGAG